MQNDYITGRRISVVEMNEDTKDDENIYAIALAIGGSLSDKGKATIIFEREDGTIGERPITACKFLESTVNRRKRESEALYRHIQTQINYFKIRAELTPEGME